MPGNNKTEVVDRLMRAGITFDDAAALRRIAMTLHRWHELECGDSNDYRSWSIVRGRGGKVFEYDDNGAPFIESHPHSGGKVSYSRIPDRETGAKKRLAAIMARYPDLRAYIQGDPRGAALYILKPGDVPDGADVDAYYSRGVAVYR